jgi:glycolate oxidase iron-sulfur subunit
MTVPDALASLAGALAAEEESLLACVHCGFCLPACPTYVRLGDEADSPRGRLYLMRAVVEGRLSPDSPALHTHLDRCLGCRACEPVCPSGVPYGHLLERGRAVVRSHRSPPGSVRLLLAVLARPLVARAAWALARWARATRLPALAARVLPRRWGVSAAMLASSAPARLPVRGGSVGSAARRGGPAPDDAPPERGRVAMLRGCVQEGLFGRVNRATERTLGVNGYQVVPVSGQGCCGALHAHAGDLEGARALARRNVAAFGASSVDFVCVNAAGCGVAMREYGELLAGDPSEPQAREVAARVRDVSHLLAEAGPRPGAVVEARVAWDPPCHLLHAQGEDRAPLQVLDAIPGLARRPLFRASECCGGAGLYGLTHAELGGHIGDDKVGAIRASGADVVVTANPGCHMQIGGTLLLGGGGPSVVHLVELLDESYRRAGLVPDPPKRGRDRG